MVYKTTSPTTKRLRISIDVNPELRRRIRLAAARNDVLVSAYILTAIEERLRADAAPAPTGEEVLSSVTDEILSELWDNDLDDEYSRLDPR